MKIRSLLVCLAAGLLGAGSALGGPCPTSTVIPNFHVIGSNAGSPRTVSYGWDVPAGAPAGTVYQLRRSTAADYCSAFGAFDVVGETSATSITARLDVPDRVYQFSVTVKGCDGVHEQAVIVDDSLTAPPSPGVVAARSSASNSVLLQLTQPDARTAGQVVERAGADGNFTPIGLNTFAHLCPSGQPQTLMDIGLAPGTYTYRVYSYNQATGTRITSNVASVTVGPASPSVAEFRSVPAAITAGQKAVLAWASSNGDSVRIDPQIGRVDPTGAVTVTPTQTTTYTLTVTGAGGTRTKTVTVEVAPTTPLPTATILTVASTPGMNGSYFRTGVQLHNAGTATAYGRVVFHARDKAGSDADPSLRYFLQPGETRDYPDLLAAMGASGAGSADVIAEVGDVPALAARVYNDAGDKGTTGVTIGAVTACEALRAGDSGSVLAPADQARYRFSLGVRTLAAGATLTFTVKKSDGSVAKTMQRTYAGDTAVQASASDFLEGYALEGNESIEISVGAGAAFVYGTVTDNVTNDPSLQRAVRTP